MQKELNANIKTEINYLLESFKDPDSLNLITKSVFKRTSNIPSDNWSILNRIIMFRHGTMDARNPKAWFRVGRKVTKGNHFCILAPKIAKFNKIIEEQDSSGKWIEREEEITRVIGYYPIAVWPVEKTVGKEVKYEYDSTLPEFYGANIAKKLGITIKQSWARWNDVQYGLANYNKSRKEIQLATDDEYEFFKVLCEVVMDKLKIKDTNNIIAPISAAVVMNMLGLYYGTKNVYDYISEYSKFTEKDMFHATIGLIGQISKVVGKIIELNNKE